VEVLAAVVAVTAFTMPHSASVGVSVLVTWNLVLSYQWLKWSARHRI
jgi:hypothetical protein